MHILYHGNCPDGFGAALSAWIKYGDNAIYTPVFHNEKPPQIQSKEVIMIDFCYPLDVMESIARQAESFTIIDHHAGISHVIEKIESLPNVKAVCDLNHSGAYLAWEYFHPGIEVPKLLKFIEDRDCHFNKMENAQAALMWIDTQPFVFSLWKAFANFTDEVWDKIVSYNQPMVKKFNSMAMKAAKQSVKTTLGGYPAAFCFGTEETASDIALNLAEMVSGVGIVFVLQSSGSIKASLRTKEDINLIPIAQKLGGNGHPYAAAFPCSPEKLAFALSRKDLFEYNGQ
jgi:hypothetical protein